MNCFWDIIKSSSRPDLVTQRIKKILLLSLVILQVICVDTCKSFDTSILTHKEKVDTDVKPMRVIVNYDSLGECYPWEDNTEINNIANVIKNNLDFGTDARTHYLSVLVRKREFGNNLLWSLTGFSLGALNLLGAPTNSFSNTLQLSAAIMDANGKVLKVYETYGTNTEYVALYHGYSSDDAGRTLIFKTIGIACKDLRDQLKKDARNINMLIK